MHPTSCRNTPSWLICLALIIIGHAWRVSMCNLSGMWRRMWRHMHSQYVQMLWRVCLHCKGQQVGTRCKANFHKSNVRSQISSLSVIYPKYPEMSTKNISYVHISYIYIYTYIYFFNFHQVYYTVYKPHTQEVKPPSTGYGSWSVSQVDCSVAHGCPSIYDLSLWPVYMAMPPRKWRSPATSGVQIIYMAVCQNLVPLVNIKIAGKWMFIPLKMVLIGIDPYSYLDPGQQHSTQRWQWKTSMFNIAHRINHGKGNQNDSSRNIKSGFYLDRLSRNTLPETWFGIGIWANLGFSIY